MSFALEVPCLFSILRPFAYLLPGDFIFLSDFFRPTAFSVSLESTTSFTVAFDLFFIRLRFQLIFFSANIIVFSFTGNRYTVEVDLSNWFN